MDWTRPQDRNRLEYRRKTCGLTNLRSLGIASLLVLAALGGRAQRRPDLSAVRQQFLRNLVAAAIERTRHQVTYDPGYVSIGYPGGDVPADSGVCSDEIIRIYRAVGIDLQKEVHEDIVRNFPVYPMSRWQQERPDRNIDHRRVPNLMVFFHRKGEELPISLRASDYRPGDLVAWDLGNGAVHIGMVVDRMGGIANRYRIVHNVGAGPQMEDVLFDWKIIGHYRYFGPPQTTAPPITDPSSAPRPPAGANPSPRAGPSDRKLSIRDSAHGSPARAG